MDNKTEGSHPETTIDPSLEGDIHRRVYNWGKRGMLWKEHHYIFDNSLAKNPLDDVPIIVNNSDPENSYEDNKTQVYVLTKIRYILFPFKVLSLVSLLSTIAFTYILYFSKLFKDIDSNKLFIIKLGVFGSFLIISLITKLLQAMVSYIEVKKNYLVDKSLYIKTKIPARLDSVGFYHNSTIQYIKIKEDDFSPIHKLKYFFLITISLLITTFFILPFLLQTFSEKFKLFSEQSQNILNTFSKYFYTICFTTILILFIIIHVLRISVRMQNKVWPPIDTSIRNKHIDKLCKLDAIYKTFENLSYMLINLNFIKKYSKK